MSRLKTKPRTDITKLQENSSVKGLLKIPGQGRVFPAGMEQDVPGRS